MALLDLIGRIMLTHQIDRAFAARALEIDIDAAEDLVRCGCLATPLAEGGARLELLASILIRLEIRFLHDSKAIRATITTPIAALGNRAPIDLVAGDVQTLRLIRNAVDHMTAPPIRRWRVGH